MRKNKRMLADKNTTVKDAVYDVIGYYILQAPRLLDNVKSLLGS